MPVYILASKLKEMNAGERERIGKEWLAKIKETCPNVKWLNHYALLGPYDFLSIYEAPDDRTAMKVSLITLAHGALKAESWTAMPYAEFLELAKEVT
ncbi:MAG: GYD domain-containing protein [Candidatus Odinarchaeota archaeon]